MRMAWPERVAAFMLLLLIVCLVLLSATADNHGHPVPIGDKVSALFAGVGVMALYTVLPVWAVLRAIDLIFNGPSRRRGVFTVRPL